MTSKHKGPIVNDELCRLNPRLAAKIQVERLRKRLAERDERRVLEKPHPLVQAWWETNHGAGEG